MNIILASQSPRRRQLLNMLGLKDFAVVPAAAEPDAPPDLSPGEAVAAVAAAKAAEVASKCAAEDLVIAADTMVLLDGRLLGKPEDAAEARAMLQALSGRRHTVCSGVALVQGGRTVAGYEATDVFFRTLQTAEIDWYVATGEPMDKAGAYGIQGPGSILIERIEGDFFNVMGFPIARFYQMLGELGFPLLRYIAKGEDIEEAF